jgi:N-acetylglucosamine-6-sulfatase
MGVIRRSDILPEYFQGDFMQKKIIGGILAIVIIAAGFYIVQNTRLFKDSPNVIVILTDDMDTSLMPFVEQTNRLIGEQGATFTNFYVTTPACCPSRASILRGQYAHNTDILENSPGFARFFRLKHEENALPVWVNNAGYQTAMFGKYLNNYPVNAGREYVPPGWTEWGGFFAMQPTHYFYDYTMNENGTLVEYGSTPEDYSTDVIRDKSLRFIEKNTTDDTPFLLYISVYAPHGPALAAPRHEGLFNDLTYPLKPSFAEEDLSDKPQIIRALTETGDDFDVNDANAYFQSRARTLQAVDELVADIVHTLEASGQLENTYIIFTSDNGFRLGEHGIPSGKGTPYEEDILVPFLIRGPGVTPGTQVTQITANIDLAPTIADMIGVRAPDYVDGRSFLPLLRGEQPEWRKALLIEFGYGMDGVLSDSLVPLRSLGHGSMMPTDPEWDTLLARVGGGAFRGIRTGTFTFVKYENGELEYYDMVNDPYQLENSAHELDAQTLDALLHWLDQLNTCAAKECRQLEQSPPDGILD